MVRLVEISEVEALFEDLMPWDKKEFINKHADLIDIPASDVSEEDYSLDDVIESAEEAVEAFGEDEMLYNISDTAIAEYVLEHKKVLKLIFARIVKEDRIR